MEDLLQCLQEELRQEKRAYRDLCHPLNQETRELLTKEIFEAYVALEEKEE